ncbi:MAG: carboxylesterase family protein [Rhizomicrobium sp.]|jgi:para-nitrobenzyl esterase
MIKLRHLLFCAVTVLSPATSVPARAENGPTVDAPAGQLKGQADGAIRVFKGIPYALPPTGAARWKPPGEMPRWTGIRTATRFGPECVQPKTKLSSIYTGNPVPMSEDCLTLNIWAPSGARNAPVFFWIYGGALWGGANRDPIYDGAKLASRGMVVVTINYRLGVLGWLAHPELSAESPFNVSGNYGLLDQIAALKWVKRNIGAFGGDASNVTIAGESAGALSVMYLMVSPKARGLFARAIAQSAYMISTQLLKQSKYGTPSAEESGAKLAAAVQAPNIAVLRAMDPDSLTAAAAAVGFAPFGAVDGYVLPDQLVDVFDRGEQAHVPLLAGFNNGEIRSLRILAPPVPASQADYEKAIHERYLDLADGFLNLYPATNMQESIWATTRDALYGWTAERLVRKQTVIGAPAYLYYFDHGYPAEDSAGYHAFHGSELPYVFGTSDRTPPLWPKIPATPVEQALSDAMIDYWSSFARTGQPETQGGPEWKTYDSTGAYMDFTDAPHLADHLLPGMYALHERAMCRRHASGNLPWNWNVGIVSPPLPGDRIRCP